MVARGGNRFLAGAVWGVLAVLLLAGLARVPTTIPTGEIPDLPEDPPGDVGGDGPATDDRDPRTHDPGIHGPRFPREDPTLGTADTGPVDRRHRPVREEPMPCGSPSFFTNASQFESYLGPPSSSSGYWWSSTVTASGGSSSSMVSYSGTNNQVDGVDEADTVKTDGTFLYIADGRNVRIYRAYPTDDAGLVSNLSFPDSVLGLFVNDGRLVVLWRYYHGLGNRTWAYATVAHVLDIRRPEEPVLERNVTIVARYIAARMIREQVYLVAGAYAYGSDRRPLLPLVFDDGVRIDVNASDVAYFPESPGSSQYAIVLGFNLERRDRPVFLVFLAGGRTEVYVSARSVYLASSSGSSWYGPQRSWIQRIGISETVVCYVGGAEVPGRILNQFSMDEFRTHLRVATTVGRLSDSSAVSSLYVLNRTMALVGLIGGIAPGEEVYSARFLGDRAYLVTFKKVDPLFVIDLSDPTAPRILGYLKIPGYSTYLHPYDEDHVIGLGKDAYDMGTFAWYQGVKLSLFDVSDVEHPREESNLVIGDRGTSSTALYEHKAFLFVPARGLLVLPIDLYEINRTRYPDPRPEQFGELVWQGAYAISVTEDRGIEIAARIAHNADPRCSSSWGWSYGCNPYTVQRSLYIGDVLYTISRKWIVMTEIDTFGEIRRIAL